MRWLAKAAAQKGMGALPQGERLNYVFQRRVLHSLPAGDGALRQKFSRAVQHLRAYEEPWAGVPAAAATFYEFGAGWDLRPPGGPISRLEGLEERFGIRYLAPCDARGTGLPAESIDFVSSTDTCEHIPGTELAEIFRECHRLLRPGGAFSCRIDLQDHYAYFDRSLSKYNF